MNKKQIVEKLVRIANQLDEMNLINESDTLTKVAEDVSVKYDSVFNPDFEADDAEGRNTSNPVYDAIMALVQAHRDGKIDEELFTKLILDIREENKPKVNTKQLTLEGNSMDDPMGDSMSQEESDFMKMNQNPEFNPEEDEFFVDGMMPEDVEGEPSFDDLLAEYQKKYGKGNKRGNE